MDDSLVDFHCHLDLFPNFEEAVNFCEEKEIHTLSVTTTPQAWPRNKEIISSKKYVRCALGLHPQLIHERAGELKLWEIYLPQAKYIGEIGLDAGPMYYRFFEEQKRVFNYMLNACSEAGNKVLSLHSVRSVPKILDFIEISKVTLSNKIILHWFTGTASQCKRAIDLGCFFSINSEMLKNEQHLKMIKNIPLSRIVTESDSPFTSDLHGSKNPSHVQEAVTLLASVWNLNVQEAKQFIFRTLLLIEN